jgi:hypothetical protein
MPDWNQRFDVLAGKFRRVAPKKGLCLVIRGPDLFLAVDDKHRIGSDLHTMLKQKCLSGLLQGFRPLKKCHSQAPIL